MVTVPQRVNDYITAAGGYAMCDSCIQAQLALPRPQQVQQITATLATTSDFVRADGKCGLCLKEAKVINRAI